MALASLLGPAELAVVGVVIAVVAVIVLTLVCAAAVRCRERHLRRSRAAGDSLGSPDA